MYGFVSPKDWMLKKCDPDLQEIIANKYGIDISDIENRCYNNIYCWLPQQYSQELKAFYGYYSAKTGYTEPPQTVNLIIPWELIAAYDRYGDRNILKIAENSAEYYYKNFVITHPMSIAIGGAYDSEKNCVWLKYTAENSILNGEIFERTKNQIYLDRAVQSAKFLIEARMHDYAAKFWLKNEVWDKLGWMSFGRCIEALLLLYELTGNKKWRNEAVKWGEYALGLQGQNGCFYLINNDYYNSDIAADEIRGLTYLYEETNREEFLNAAKRFANWHIENQREDGAWYINIDREGNIVCDIIGPGDTPNIAISMLRLHKVTADEKYLISAIKAIKYSMSVQATPTSGHPYLDDPKVLWGFWSWMPYYDYTLSGDQATHHVRGMMFLCDYLASLEERQ